MKLRAIYESIKLARVKSEASRVLYEDATNFIYDYLSLSTNITIDFKKSSRSTTFGHFDFKNKIVIEDSTPNLVIGNIAHELTHVKQYEDRDLLVDGQYIIWKRTEKFLLRDYSTNKKYDVHVKWPWEAEAYKNQKILPNLYYNSAQFVKTMNSDPTLKYMMDTGLFP